ncbi:MAG: methyltransferase domain-containing protein [Phycisphaerales bacterium]|nr:MAG: methyltransferase domain-containing protein [Phycisphaerales bacterium]
MPEPSPEPDSPHSFVSRAGRKLNHALEHFQLDVTGFTCADFGCNVGGFTDCLLQRGAERVYAIDTGYGTLAWLLRSDERVVVLERTNALHADPPDESVDLITIDLAWTPQRHAIPAALKWLQRSAVADGNASGRIITLIKPHYELTEPEKAELLVYGQLDPGEAERITRRVLDAMPALGAAVIDWTLSPITGGKSGRKRRKSGTASGQVGPGNVEFLALLQPAATTGA